MRNFNFIDKCKLSAATALLLLGLSSNSVQAGAITHYSFDSDTSSSTNPALDLIPGAPFGMHFVSGQFGNAVAMLSGSYLTSNGYQPLLSDAAVSSFTLSFWYAGFGGAPNTPLVSNRSSHPIPGFPAEGYEVSLSSSGVSATLATSGGDVTVSGTPAATAFNHVTMVSDISTASVSLYINGVLHDLAAGVGAPTPAPLAPFTVGNTSLTGGLTGLIDELWLFDSALTTGQVQNLYNFNNIDGEVLSTVSEPGTLALLGGAIFGLGAFRKRNRKSLSKVSG